jgi:hypothetical protein
VDALAKAGGGGLGGKQSVIDVNDPKYHAMRLAFKNLVGKYDNPLLAAAALDAGTATVDNAIRQASRDWQGDQRLSAQVNRDHMYLLTQAALGAHQKLSRRTARKSGGRTGYALPGVCPSLRC